MRQLLFEIRNDDALEEALLKIRDASEQFSSGSILIHYYIGDLSDPQKEERSRFAGRIAERTSLILPEAEFIGVSTAGEIIRAELTGSCVLLSAFLFESTRIRILTFPQLPSKEREAGIRLLSETEAAGDLKCVELLIAGREIDSAPVYESLKKCRPELSFFGGYAAEHDPENDSAFLFTKDGFLREALAAVFYEGKDLHVDAGRTTGWKPLGSSFRVTRAEGRRLYGVNGIPAYELYDRFLKFPEEESFTEYSKEFPLMLRKGKMKLLRHPQEKYEDSSILLDGNVKEGDEICLSYGAPLEIVHRINIRCGRIRDFEPETVLLYSCQGRKNYWGELIGWEMEPFQKLAETGGACLSGQIMRNSQTGRVIEHRLTLLSVALREGEKTGRSIPEIAMDDEILKGRMSLVHRMSTLIESMVEELQKTNDALFGMNERLARANEELHRIAITDELTGIYNRREIERRIRNALEKAKEDHRKIALVMTDIDFFKKVNDTFGHDVGDIVLKDVSAILRDYTDESLGEAAGRWGGEEFFILLPDKGFEDAVALAEKIRTAVEKHDFPEAGHLTVSMGVTSADAESDYQAIFIKADNALYQSKQGGRNRVTAVP